jgi:hypothetical protein
MIEAIELELGRLKELLEKYAPLVQKSKMQEPDFIEMASLSVLLHAFYSGLENIFVRIARKIDGELPSGQHWHQDLLAQMKRQTNLHTTGTGKRNSWPHSPASRSHSSRFSPA